MNQKTYIIWTAIIFLIIALLHLTRISIGWEAVIGGWVIPQWASWIALAVSGFFAYSGFRLSR